MGDFRVPIKAIRATDGGFRHYSDCEVIMKMITMKWHMKP